MTRHILGSWLALCLLADAGFAQFRPVNPAQMGERIVAIVPVLPVTGLDARRKEARPLFVDIKGVTSYKAIISDNGKWALIEVVARSRKVFDEAFASRDFQQAATLREGLPFDVMPRIVHKDSRQADELLADFQKLKRGFRPEHFGVGGR